MIWRACLIATARAAALSTGESSISIAFFITENNLFSVIKKGKAIPRPAVAVTKPLAGEPGVTKLRVRYKVREN